MKEMKTTLRRWKAHAGAFLRTISLSNTVSKMIMHYRGSTRPDDTSKRWEASAPSVILRANVVSSLSRVVVGQSNLVIATHMSAVNHNVT